MFVPSGQDALMGKERFRLDAQILDDLIKKKEIK
jgi:hypothetical protein